MKLLILLFFGFFFGGGGFVLALDVDDSNLSDVDRCISFMQKNLKHKNSTQTLGGLVGLGWDDLSNSYTIPVFAVTYKKCLTDPDNRYLIQDNIYLIPIKNTALDRTSTVFNSYDDYMSASSNKLTISGSASFKGKGGVSASFSKENSETKHEFVKVDSIMLQNKLTYHAFDLIANENAGFHENFIRRVKEIAQAVNDGEDLKATYLAELLVADYGTHVINKATASAEIIQETYINKREVFKGESHMSSIKAGISGEFDGQAYGGGGGVSNENKHETEKNETTTTTTTRSLIKTRGGPNINRMSNPNINDSMIHVDNLVGINQQGKFLYDVIPAMPLPEFSKMVKYTVKEKIFNAVSTYYKFNSLPGCMKMDSDNFNPIANYDDSSCDTPKTLYTFGGVYQTCAPIYSWAGDYDVEFGPQCERYERTNRATGGMSCPNGTRNILIDSMKVGFLDRTVKMQKRKCWKFIPYCWYEMVDVVVEDEIYVATYWCMGEQEVPVNNHNKLSNNTLSVIMRHDMLTIIEKMPKVLQMLFPRNYNFMELILNETVCKIEDRKNDISYDTVSWQSLQDSFAYQGERYYCHSCPDNGLNITFEQMQLLMDYPETLTALLPILDLEPNVKTRKDLFKDAAQNALILQKLIFKDFVNLNQLENPQPAFFGGFYRKENNNPFTGRPECPANFETIDILLNLKMCVSYDQQIDWPLRLGKIFLCGASHPICPRGYSEYLAATIDGCDIKYCIRFQKRDDIAPPTINKPPFADYKIHKVESFKTETSTSSSSKVKKTNLWSFL